MTDGNTRKKAQAVFFSLVMVLSMVGGSVALAGSAVATTPTGGSLSDDVVQPGTSVSIEDVSANTDDNPLYILAANETSETINGSTLVSDGDISTSESWSTTFDPTAGTGLDMQDGETFQLYLSEGQTYSDRDNDIGSLTVDGTGPNVATDSATPASDEVVNDPAQDIVVPVSDSTTNVESIKVELYSDSTQMGAYELGPNNEPDGISYQSEELTISPGSGNIPLLQDGTTEVYVTATDTAGNTVEDASFTFTVETGGVDFTVDDTAGTNAAEESFDVNENNPFGTSEELLVYNENRSDVDFDVTINPPAASDVDEGAAELIINGPGVDGEVTLDNESDAYDAAAGAFEVNQGADDYNFSADGTYDVTVSGADTAGNSDEYSFDIKVDTTAPTAESITAPNQITEADFGEEQQLDVTFDEPVDPDNVDVELRVDGAVATTVSNNVESGYTETVTLEFTPSEGGLLDEIENGSAVANVTAANDVANNDLTTEGQTETTFEVFTQTPQVSVSTPSPSSGSNFGGGVNFTSFVDSVDDDVDVTYEIIPGTDGNPVDITSSAENYDTTGLPDGTHTLRVSVADNVSNTNSAETDFDLDNNQQLTVTQQYLDGTVNGDYDAGESDVSVGAIFDSVPGDTVYTVDGNSADAGDTISAAENRGDTISVTASSDDADETRTVTLSFAPLEGAENVNADTIDIGIRADRSVDTLNVSVKQIDGYYAASEDTLTYEDFNQYNVSDDVAIYSATVEDLSDGNYEVSITDSDNGDVDPNTDFPVNSITVDDEEPELLSASVVDGDENGLTIDAKFDENVADFDSVLLDDDQSIVTDAVSDNDGTVTVSVSEEVQTADGPLLNFTSVDDSAGSTNEEASTSVATITLDLSADGLNVVSIPAETGSVALDDLDLTGVDSVMAYNESSGSNWDVYDAETGDGDLQEMTGGVGYIVKADEDRSVAVNAQNVPSDNTAQAINSVSLDSGWNLVGAYQEGDQPVSQALDPLPSGADYSIEKGYTGTNVDTLEPGAGYWMFTNDETAYHVPVDYTGLQSSQPTVYNVNVDDSTTDGSSAFTVSAEVDADNPVEQVVVDASTIGVDNVELTYDEATGEYNKDITTNYPVDFESNADADVTVTAFDIYGNLGQADTTTTATENVAPSLDSATKVDDTTIDVTLSDAGSGIDSTTIDQADFNLGTGSIQGIEASSISDGDNTGTVTINLASAVDSTTVDVDISGNDGIDDVAGNTLDNSATVTAESMDGVAPSLDSASQSTTSGTTTVTLDISDSGSGLLASSITESSFELTSATQTPTVAADGFSTDVTTDGTGSGTVTFALDGDYSAEDITVAIAASQSIDDVAGNQKTTGSATATAPA